MKIVRKVVDICVDGIEKDDAISAKIFNIIFNPNCRVYKRFGHDFVRSKVQTNYIAS